MTVLRLFGALASVAALGATADAAQKRTTIGVT
jgi:hypothetical protein